jgi:Domain of unknown function (DUF5658)
MSVFKSRETESLERRSRDSRRKAGPVKVLFSRRRRRHSSGRRGYDFGYVDVYDGRTWAVALSVLALSFCDSLMTVLQVSAGTVKEWNPMLYYLLEERGPWAFVGVKAGVTALAMAVIVLHKEWRFGRAAARSCLWIYIVLSFYHLYLILVHSSLGGSGPTL